MTAEHIDGEAVFYDHYCCAQCEKKGVFSNMEIRTTLILTDNYRGRKPYMRCPVCEHKVAIHVKSREYTTLATYLYEGAIFEFDGKSSWYSDRPGTHGFFGEDKMRRLVAKGKAVRCVRRFGV